MSQIEDKETLNILEEIENLRKTTKLPSAVTSVLDNIETFLKENPLLTEERAMREYNSGRQVGWQSERQRCVKLVMDIAAEHFVKHDDEKARFYRDLAEKMNKPA